MSPEDQTFVDQLREQYQAPAMTGADITRFDARLAARRRKRVQFAWLGGLATAAVALTLAVGLSGDPVSPKAKESGHEAQWTEALTFEDLDVNPFDFLEIDVGASTEYEDTAYAIESDWPADFDGLSYLIEPMQKEI